MDRHIPKVGTVDALLRAKKLGDSIRLVKSLYHAILVEHAKVVLRLLWRDGRFQLTWENHIAAVN